MNQPCKKCGNLTDQIMSSEDSSIFLITNSGRYNTGYPTGTPICPTCLNDVYAKLQPPDFYFKDGLLYKKCCDKDMIIDMGDEIAWASCPICNTEYDWE